MEPSILGVGPSHVAVGINNRAWFYILTQDGNSDKNEIDTKMQFRNYK